jgi:hypothetical protein
MQQSKSKSVHPSEPLARARVEDVEELGEHRIASKDRNQNRAGVPGWCAGVSRLWSFSVVICTQVHRSRLFRPPAPIHIDALSPHHQQCAVRGSGGVTQNRSNFFFEFCMRNAQVVASFASVSTRRVLRMCSQPYRPFMAMVRTPQPPTT